ncbi:MAG: carbamate kinase [Candidatus Njordarchaeia archaeon]
MERIVIALGGNALLQKGEKGTYEEQFKNARKTAERIADLVELGYDIVLTHGNGPQVGALLVQNDAAKDEIPPMPMDVLNAETQGLIGYMIQNSLKNVLLERGIDKKVATIVTQVVVREDDPAFQNPTKYVGPYYTEEEAKKLMREKGWVIKPDPRGGWRRVVPSPVPIDIVEKDVILAMLKESIIPITVGGGGIPVVKRGDKFYGVEAVIDKDLASSLVAKLVNADMFIILTDVENVMLNYGKPDQVPLRKVKVSELEKYYNDGHFPPGSMGPKVKAMLNYMNDGGKIGIIAHLNKLLEAVELKSGTIITR